MGYKLVNVVFDSSKWWLVVEKGAKTKSHTRFAFYLLQSKYNRLYLIIYMPFKIKIVSGI